MPAIRCTTRPEPSPVAAAPRSSPHPPASSPPSVVASRRHLRPHCVGWRTGCRQRRRLPLARSNKTAHVAAGRINRLREISGALSTPPATGRTMRAVKGAAMDVDERIVRRIIATLLALAALAERAAVRSFLVRWIVLAALRRAEGIATRYAPRRPASTGASSKTRTSPAAAPPRPGSSPGACAGSPRFCRACSRPTACATPGRRASTARAVRAPGMAWVRRGPQRRSSSRAGPGTRPEAAGRPVRSSRNVISRRRSPRGPQAHGRTKGR